MAERLANLGYLALIKEVTKGTPLSPTDFVPLYKEGINTNLNLVEDNPIAGNKFVRYQVLQGQRSHKGDITVMAEPNTIGRLMDMILTKGTTTGAGPYTHPFTLSTAADPKSYTIDVSTGNVVARYWGVEASKCAIAWDKNEMRIVLSLSALGSFQGRQIATVAGSGPYTVTLDTTYDPAPNTGLVIGDLIRFRAANGTTVDATVATLVGTTQFTTATNPTPAAAGDMVYLRPATTTFNNLTPFLWSNTQFKFGATAAAAAAAAQTRVEQGSGWTLTHKFESDDGAMRSGGLDPAALVRTQGDIDLKIKKFFDTPTDIQNFNQLNKTACVVSHFSGATNQYELRLTYNHLKTDGKVVPDIESGNIAYSEIDYKPQYDTTDGQGFDIKVLNNLSAI